MRKVYSVSYLGEKITYYTTPYKKKKRERERGYKTEKKTATQQVMAKCVQ